MPAQSPQEAFVRSLLDAEVGAAFTFAPDKWIQSKGLPKEPFDVAWVCNDAAFMFAMQHSNSSEQKIIDHNLGQLRGWQRRWLLDKRLKGSNAVQSFDLGFDEVPYHVLVSVLGGAHAVGEWHPLPSNRSPEQARTAMVVSFPARVVTRVLRGTGGMHALLDLALWLKDEGRAVPEKEMLAKVDDMHEFATKVAIHVCEGTSTPARRAAARRLLRGTLSLPVFVDLPDGTGQPEADRQQDHLRILDFMAGGGASTGGLHDRGGALEILNDLQWHEILAFIGNITKCWSQFDVPRNTVLAITPLGFETSTGVRLLAGGVPIGNRDEEQIAKIWFDMWLELAVGHDAGLIGLLFRMDYYGGPPEAYAASAYRMVDSHLASRLRDLIAES